MDFNKLNAAYRSIALKVKDMVTTCLSLQREGDLSEEMLENLIEVFDVMTPEQRLIAILCDL